MVNKGRVSKEKKRNNEKVIPETEEMKKYRQLLVFEKS